MKPSVSKIIDQLVAKLPRTEVVSYDQAYISGAELLLTPMKDVNGKPIKKDENYAIDVPVLRVIGHRGRLRNAWLAHGIQGMYNYLLPYYGHDKANAFKQRFMRASV